MIAKRYESEFILLDSILTEAVNLGSDVNSLRAECVGSRLSLYVNGEPVLEVYDSDISHGDVGLVAETYSANSTEILFDNFFVYSP